MSHLSAQYPPAAPRPGTALQGAVLMGQRGFTRRSRCSLGRGAWFESFTLLWSLPSAKVSLQLRLGADLPVPSFSVSSGAGTMLPRDASASALPSTQRDPSSRDKVIRGPPWKNISYFHRDKNKMSLPGHFGRAVSPPLPGLWFGIERR